MGTGVQLFFVISGFLITGILLDNRGKQEMMGVWRRFYARRALKIFPLFYLAIFGALIFGLAPIHVTWPWHVSYLSNFYFVHQGNFDPPPNYFGPFWSLAVEEAVLFVLAVSGAGAATEANGADAALRDSGRCR